DRFNIKYWKNLTTPVALNAQAMINCRAGGDCNGGNPADVYSWAQTVGIPHSSCEQYTAHNSDHGILFCEEIDQCKDCTWPPCPVGQSCQD
ncbi:MAG: hypothetical protein ACK55Z_14130, partial [bacterium]